MRNCAVRDGYELTAWVLWDTGITADGLVLDRAQARCTALVT